ncbi:MAG: hypothetical protein WAT39_12945 [Planctomycetota bacterium]
MHAVTVTGVPNLRDAHRMWLNLGGEVTFPAGTGEILFSHPDVGKIRVNYRRKDSSRKLVSKLRRLISLCADGVKGAR